MLGILDIEMVKNFLLLGLCKVGMGVLAIELAPPDLNLPIFLLDKLDEIFILIHEMSVLGQKQLDFLLEVIDFLTFSDLEQQLLVYRNQLGFQLAHSLTPIF